MAIHRGLLVSVVMVVSIILALCVTLYGAEVTIIDIDRLFSDGKHDQVLQEILRARTALAAAKRVTAWEIDYRGEVLRVARGKECLYYLLHLSNSHKDAPGRQTALPSVSVNYSRSEWYTQGGEQRISSAVAYNGRQIRSKRGGGVRVLDGTKMTDLDPVMAGVEDWAIHLAPAGPLERDCWLWGYALDCE